MKKLANFVIVISIVFILMCFYIIVFPDTLITVNAKLNNGNNIIAYLSMLFSAIAILLAALAYRQTTSSPKLHLNIFSWMAGEEGPILDLEEKNMVPMHRPQTSWELFLSNTGEISAKNPIVKIVFDNAYFSGDAFEGWKAVDHDNALGWYGFQWTPKIEDSQVIHVGFDYQLPTLYFSGEYFEADCSITIYIAADGLETSSQIRQINFYKHDLEEVN